MVRNTGEVGAVRHFEVAVRRVVVADEAETIGPNSGTHATVSIWMNTRARDAVGTASRFWFVRH
jgi:hypothetical protein